MVFLFQALPFALVAVLIQVLAALPWLAVLYLKFRSVKISAANWKQWAVYALAALGAVSIVASVLLGMHRDPESLQYAGGVYGAILHVQLVVDFFVLVFAVLFAVWPKGAAVALSAFREGWRQPMFWLIVALFLTAMFITPWLPYFTLESSDEQQQRVGGDFKMVKELGYDFTMVAAALFGVLAASMSISEEIEGRTAITLMSKPISRRQFLLGKFAGILLASLIITGVLSWFFDGTLLMKLYYDKDPITIPPLLEDWTLAWVERWGEVPAYFMRGAAFWLMHAGSALPGVILGFCQVMVLVAIAVALATRVPMVVNIVICLVAYFLGHLAPVLQQVSTGNALVHFMAQLVDYIFPGLELFNLAPIVVRDVPPPSGPFGIYVSTVVLYAVLYTTITLLFGLILFEDRDLA